MHWFCLVSNVLDRIGYFIDNTYVLLSVNIVQVLDGWIKGLRKLKFHVFVD